ncbi:GPI ethanolamine phosphate transferase 1 [Halyomorpha halys]|uniref:GPI ethanolamine phosphate transferase 1 n=1 Tax=Halyomorpha halys TaxID=286706 RepID=UPI0006D506CC|nr:GPI ethanolamine phosphate transferase 1-like [Halyomorpha halys]
MGFSRESLNQWLLGVIVHFILFQVAGELKEKSAIIIDKDVKPNVLDEKRPCNRLVFIVVEGLRWDVFNEKENISSFSTEVRKRGKVGPIYVNVPSNHYQGLLRMITGVPGDEGTNETLNVFQSARTVYIGPSSLRDMLNNINESYSYPEAWENLTISPNQTKGDEWVFNTWHQLLNEPTFSSRDTNLFFFYLNGFEMASQLDGPTSYRALKELKYILDSLEQLFWKTEMFFADSKTSYIVTSDYGYIEGKEDAENFLNDSMVPLITWGAGLANAHQIMTEDSRLIRKGYVRQVDLAPFISYLIGIEIPFNNFGDAPIIRLYKNRDRARLLLSNAKQLTELFLSFEKAYGFGLSSLWSPLNKYYINSYLSEIAKAFSNEDYYLSVTRSQELIDLALSGISYYRNYESNILWICALISLIGWTAVTLGWVAEKVKVTPIIQREMVPEEQESMQSNIKSLTIFQRFLTPLFVVHTICFIIFCMTIGVLLFISAPLTISLAATLAITISWLAAKCSLDWMRLYKSLAHNDVKIKKEKPLMYLIYFMVFTCFLSYPIVIQIMLSFAIMFSALSDLRNSPGQHLAYWMLSSLSYLTLLHYAFHSPYLPVLIIAAMVWIVAGAVFLNCLKVRFMDWPIFLAAFLSIALISIHSQYGPPTTGQNLILRWTPMLLIFFVPLIGSSSLPVRLFQSCLCLAVCVFLLSLSFEPISFIVIISHIFSWALLEGYSNISELASSTLHFSVVSTSITWANVRITYYFLSYILTSFLVIGNSSDIHNWPKEWPAYFEPISSMNVFIIVCFKSLPVILIENVFLAILEKKSSIGYLSVILQLSSQASLINFALIPSSSITLYNQLMFLFSLFMRPLAYLLLTPSVLSVLLGPIAPRTTTGRSPEIIQPVTIETSL